MSKVGMIRLITLLIVCCGVLVASAGSPHFIGTLRTSGGSLIVQGDLAGLGNEDVTVRLDAYATVKYLCQNRGGTVAPGRNPIVVNQIVTVQSTPDENGKAAIYLRAADPTVPGTVISPTPVSPTPKQAGCPNGNWVVIGMQPNSTGWTGAKVSVIDNPTTQVILTVNFQCNGLNGADLVCWEN